MTVMPGFGGQKMMPEVLSKVTALRQAFPSVDIQASDGSSAADHSQMSSSALSL